MRKTLTIQIPKPCKENWNAMTPKEKGRHCQVCSKTVFDFTTKTDEQIIQSFENNPKLCGRFKNTQLNRELVLSRKNKNSYLSYIASGLFAFLAFQTQEVKAQGEINITQTDSTKSNNQVKGKYGNSIFKQKTIHGTVTDENGLPLPTATIIIKGTTIGTSTDFDGNFSIQIKPKDILTISYIGYITKEVNTTNNKNYYEARLKVNKEALKNIVITSLGFPVTSYNSENNKDQTTKNPHDQTKKQ